MSGIVGTTLQIKLSNDNSRSFVSYNRPEFPNKYQYSNGSAIMLSMNLIASVNAHIASTSPALKEVISAIPRNQPLPSFYWLTFFWGGALGAFTVALIVLNIERILNVIISSKKFKKEKIQITKALDTEIDANIDFCNHSIDAIRINPLAIIYPKFDSIWLQTYAKRYIDFTDEDSLRLFSFLDDAKKYMEIVQEMRASLHMLMVTSRALTNFTDIYSAMNQEILQKTLALQATLITIKKLRKDNKIFKDEVLQVSNPQNTQPITDQS